MPLPTSRPSYITEIMCTRSCTLCCVNEILRGEDDGRKEDEAEKASICLSHPQHELEVTFAGPIGCHSVQHNSIIHEIRADVDAYSNYASECTRTGERHKGFE